MGTTSPNMSGKNCKFRLFLEGGAGGMEQVILKVKSWEAGPDVTKINDGENGADRDELQRIVNFFSLQAVSWMPDTKAIEALLRDIDNDDALVSPLEKAVGLLIYPNNGTKASFSATGVCIDDWKWASAGRTERQLVTIPLRCQYLKPTKTL